MTCRFRTIHGSIREISGATAEALGQELEGAMLRSGETDYEEARSLWNGMVDKRPELIIQPAGADDVGRTVRFARDHDLLLAVRGGGHNIAGTAVCEGGLMLDLSKLRRVEVDHDTRSVCVEPGCTWGDVDRATQPSGLAVPNGAISTTGVAGLTLGGGFGWASRRFGYTSDNLISAEVVTADGERLRASADQHADLFWGLRGGGGNFGVVTSFEFQARTIGPTVNGGMILYPMEHARQVIDFFRAFTAKAPDELTCLLVLRKAPPAPALPEEIHGRPVAIIAACHVGSLEEGGHALKPLKDFGEPLADLIGPKPYTAIQTMLDAGSPNGRRYYWKSDYFHDLADEAVAPMIAHAERITSPMSAVLFMHLGGAANRLPADHSAAGPRDSQYVLNVQGAWLDPAEDDLHIAWARDYWTAMHPYASGRAYMNFFTADEGRARLDEAYDEATLRRLAAIKARWDPKNLFRLNQNIAPAAADEHAA